ncbi:VOC family protein [Streptomyces sp. NPDC003328]
MHRIWHVGLAVPDLTAATAELGELFDLTWRPPVTRSLTIDVPAVDGGSRDVDVRVTFSLGGPFAVEVWQGIPGTPLAVPEAGWLHHLGYWVEDHAAERARLDRLGYPPFLLSEPGLSVNRGPGGLGLEPCDLMRDQPYLYDLFPPDSPFFGNPVLPGASIRGGVSA